LNRNQAAVRLILMLTLVFVLVRCGKKGPPFLPEKEIPYRLNALSVEQQGGGFHLEGKVVDPRDPARPVPVIEVGRVYHACYPLDNPPCENCPIDYGPFRSVRGEQVGKGRFSCQVPVKAGKGIHFFKIRLIGPEGGIGPFSDRVKIIIHE